MTEPAPLPPLAELQRKIDSLSPPAEEQGQGAGNIMRMGYDLLAGVMVGTALGYGLDRWLGSTPWLMVIFFFLGAAAGFRNMLRGLNAMEKDVKK